MSEPKTGWSDLTWVYTSSAREGEHEAEFASSAVRRVLQLSRGRGVQVRVCGGEEVWRVVKEGLEKLENVEVRRSPTVDTTSRVEVSVGDALGESVLCVSRVGLVWLVDAHWTMAQYAEWAAIQAKASGGSSLWSEVLDKCSEHFAIADVISTMILPAGKGDLETLKAQCGEVQTALELVEGFVKEVASGERGVLLRGIRKGIGAVECTVRAVEKAIADSGDANTWDHHHTNPWGELQY
jgi:hypothetical protein